MSLRTQFESMRRTLVDRWQGGRDRRARDARHRALFAGMTDGIAVYAATPDGQDFILRDINAAALRIRRMAREAALGTPLGAHAADETEVGLRQVLRRVSATGTPECHSWCHTSAGGVTACYEDLVYSLPTGELAVLCRDVTARRQAEEALRASREVLHGILNAIPVRVFWKDRNLVYRGCNSAFALDAGFARPEDLVGRDDFAMGWRDQAEQYRADDRAVIESGETRLLFEEPQTTPSGAQIHLLTSKLPLRDAAGAIVGVLGTYYDISAHRQAERDYRTLFHEMLDGFALHELIHDAAGNPCDYRFLAVNPAFERLVGVPAGGLVGRTVRELLPDIAPFGLEAYARVTRTGEPAQFESHARGLGKFLRVAAFRPAPGHFACTVADITAQRQAEEEQGRLEEQLRQAQKLEAVGQLASGIAHEINTPAQFVGDNLQFLSTVLRPAMALIAAYREGSAALPPSPATDALRARLAAREAAVDIDFLLENVPAALAAAGDGVARISTIVSAMREFAHPDRVAMEPADINRALETTLTVARNTYKHVADIETEFGELPPVVCHVGELNQVFLNLLVNAARAIADLVADTGARGLIRLRTTHEGDHVRVDITDSGIGMPAEIRARVFDPFFTTRTVGQGSGQGLAVAYAIVTRKHGGQLSCVSEVGRGSTFSLRLAIEGPSAAVVDTPDAAGGSSARAA